MFSTYEVLHVFQVYKLDIILIASSAIIYIYICIYLWHTGLGTLGMVGGGGGGGGVGIHP